MKILAIDTSNYVLGIALIDGDTVIGEYITNLKKNHSVRVMPAIDALMRDCDLKAADLSKIVVAQGPGSYTGVRIGVTIAKTLAWSLKIPLSAVSSLEVLAATCGRYFDGHISPLFDARRGQIYTGLYRFNTKEHLTVVSEDKLILSKDWAQHLKELNSQILFVGNDLSIHQDVIREHLEERAIFAQPTELNPRPSELAFLGREKSVEDVHTFVPNYIRLAEAEANWLKLNQDIK